MFSFSLVFLVSRENLKLEDPRLLEFILENSRIVTVSNVICSYYWGLVVGSTTAVFPTLEQFRLSDSRISMEKSPGSTPFWPFYSSGLPKDSFPILANQNGSFV
jgi:hypothetical protein